MVDAKGGAISGDDDDVAVLEPNQKSGSIATGYVLTSVAGSDSV